MIQTILTSLLCFSWTYLQLIYDFNLCLPFAVPSAAPDDVGVKVINSSVAKVTWIRVHKEKLHGHLGGYRVIL